MNDIRYISLLTEERVEVHSKTKEQDMPSNPNLNIFKAANERKHPK